MPRRTRYAIANVAHHVVQRGNNRQPVFFSDEDRSYYLECVESAAQRHGCQVHAYVLMPNHVHLLVTPAHIHGVGRMMQSIGRCYVRYVNLRYRRTGTLWEGRYRASLVCNGESLLRCQHYIEANPVRALLAAQPADYRWSSFAHNARGLPDDCLTEHPSYRALGATVATRSAAYAERMQAPLAAQTLSEIRSALTGSRAFGPPQFERMLEALLHRRVGAAKRGRPRKPATEQVPVAPSSPAKKRRSSFNRRIALPASG